jgi:putative apbE-like lipoprotein
MRADGLSTLLMVLGPEHGYDYAVRHKLAALLVSRTPQGFQTRTTPAFDARFPAPTAP